MANPTWVTAENIQFNGTSDNAAVLSISGSNKTLILWDKMSVADQNMLIDLVDAYGGTTPLAADTAGYQTLNFNGSVVGGNATGLSSVAAATAGIATVNIGGDKLGTDASGLSSASGTYGYQVINFHPTITAGLSTGLELTAGYQQVTFSATKVGGDATGLLDDVPATAGYQQVTFGATKSGGDSTGLANDATAYTATITVDGAAKSISVVGSAAQTFTTLIDEINTDLGASGIVTIVGGNLIVASATTGSTSTVSIADTDLFSSLTDYSSIESAVAGVDIVVTTYTATITVDGVAKSISIDGSDALTFTNLLTEIDTDLAGSATSALVSGNIVITSATTGSASSVSIADTDLFSSLTDYSAINVAVSGTGSTTALTATIKVDGIDYPVSILPINIPTFGDVVDELNTILGANATASISGGDIRITSASAGESSSVVITDGTLIVSLDGYNNILPPAHGGGTARLYSAIVIVDGSTIKTVNFTGLLGDTVQHVIDEINNDLGASATAALTGGNIVITSATTGRGSAIQIQDSGFLFSSLTDYAGFSFVNGVAPVTYAATITVDGVAKSISVVGSAAQTYTTLVNEINTDLGASATAAIVGGNIVITSATTGVDSSVSVLDSTLFKAVTGFKQLVTPVAGASDFVDVMKTTRSPNGSSYYSVFDIVTVGAKPPVPPFYLENDLSSTYWDGTDWRYLVDDSLV